MNIESSFYEIWSILFTKLDVSHGSLPKPWQVSFPTLSTVTAAVGYSQRLKFPPKLRTEVTDEWKRLTPGV